MLKKITGYNAHHSTANVERTITDARVCNSSTIELGFVLIYNTLANVANMRYK